MDRGALLHFASQRGMGWLLARAPLAYFLLSRRGQRLRPPAQNGLAGGPGFVEPTPWAEAGRLTEESRIARLGPGNERTHHLDELVEALLALGFRRLDQHGAVDDQREIHGHRVEALVDQRLGEVERGDPRALQELVVEQDLVHARTRKRSCH